MEPARRFFIYSSRKKEDQRSEQGGKFSSPLKSFVRSCYGGGREEASRSILFCCCSNLLLLLSILEC
jgi:hypothetical protein